MRGGDDVPGVAGQGAHVEATHVVDEMGNDRFDDFMGEPGERG